MGRWRNLLIIALWLALLVGFWGYTQVQPLGPVALLERWLRFIAESPWGPLILLGLYAVRPLLLFPITALTLFAGFLFGPFWGTLYALAATVASSLVGYGVGYALSRQDGEKEGAPSRGIAPRFAQRLRQRSFETVLLSRLVFVPGDLVNYAAGFLRISALAFALATALGGVPGLLIAVLAGASLEGQFRIESPTINLGYLLASGVILLLSLLASRLIRRRSAVADTVEEQSQEKPKQEKP